MSNMAEWRQQYADLQKRRADILEVRAAVRAEAEAQREASGGRWVSASYNELAELSGETAQALRDVEARMRMAREMIIAARLNRGDKPDRPKNVISAWDPFLGDGRELDDGHEA